MPDLQHRHETADSGARRRDAIPMSPMKRIAFYEAYFQQFLGAQRYMFDIMVGLQSSDHFETVAISPSRAPWFDLLEERSINTEVAAYPRALDSYQKSILGGSVFRKTINVAHLLRYNLSMRRRLKRLDVDAVYCNNLRSVLSIGLAARLSGLPIVWYVQIATPYGFLDTIGFRLASRIMTISADPTSYFSPKQLKQFQHKLGHIYPGVDIEDFDQRYRAAEPVDPRRFVVAEIAGLTPRKGQDVLLRAMRLLLDATDGAPDLELWLVGEPFTGEEAFGEKLRSMCIELDLGDHVKFHGWREDIPELLAGIDVMVLPSRAEGLPKSIVEAMAAECAVVATGVGGTPEVVVDGQTGILIDYGSEQQLADALQKLYMDRALAAEMGRRGRSLVEEKFTTATTVAAFEETFHEVLGG